jgi:DNA polymerase III alpha subunit (gram-positive type)
MACTEPRLTALKIGYKGEIHRIRVDLSVFKLEELNTLFCQTFHLAPNSFAIQYKDTEGDCLNVTTEDEFMEACHVFLSGKDAVKSLRFVAVSRTKVAFQENVADPILKAIERLVETLHAALEKVKTEEWTQRAQTGMEQTNEAFHRAARDARESFAAARETLQELPFDQVLKETTEGIKCAAEGLTSFAQEVVGELNKNFKDFSQCTEETDKNDQEQEEQEEQEQVPASVTPPPVIEPEPVAQIVESLDASTESEEWEEISQQQQQQEQEELEVPIAVEVVQETIPIVVAPTEAPTLLSNNSKEELKWATELKMIRDIFPNFNISRTIEFLEQARGNVEVVLNALMEEM